MFGITGDIATLPDSTSDIFFFFFFFFLYGGGVGRVKGSREEGK